MYCGRNRKASWFFLLVAMLAAATAGHAAGDTQALGIPIDDPLTIAKCGGCHARDSAGIMRRLSFIRTTPEVWEQAIKRMVRLHGFTGHA